ncbi:MAG: hypothetical protein ABSF38_13560 [Verrucomicrobiota bacterium]|jgi:hypothetical protein
MKNPAFRTALAAITATAVCFGAPLNVASAQNTSLIQSGATQAPAWPSGVSEVMKMFRGGISADIMITYINHSPLSFYLDADAIIALQKEGVPTPVLTAMMRRYGELQRQTAMAAGPPAQVPAQAQAPQDAGAPVQVAAQAPAPQYYSYAPALPATAYTYVPAPSYPLYDPYYYYDPFYYPWYPFAGPVVFGFGFGHFGGGYGHVGGFGGHVGGGGHFGGGGRR